jgi:hypothetical protein
LILISTKEITMSKQKEALKKFIPVDQKFILSPEFSFIFHLDIEELEKTIADMPVTYGGAEDPIAYLRYFIETVENTRYFSAVMNR